MSKLAALAVAGSLIAGCATTGGKLAAGASVASAIIAVHSFQFDLFCGSSFGGPCPSNETSAVFAVIAAAAALTGLSFEVVHAATHDSTTSVATAPRSFGMINAGPITSPIPLTVVASKPAAPPRAD
ncbi:hypothetical protein BH11MYX1_BH11MYX1_39240 [soil metagenome]